MITVQNAIGAIEQTDVVILSASSAAKGSVQLRVELKYGGDVFLPYYRVIVDGDLVTRFDYLEPALDFYNTEVLLKD